MKRKYRKFNNHGIYNLENTAFQGVMQELLCMLQDQGLGSTGNFK